MHTPALAWAAILKKNERFKDGAVLEATNLTDRLLRADEDAVNFW
jgi:hypothetical protein